MSKPINLSGHHHPGGTKLSRKHLHQLTGLRTFVLDKHFSIYAKSWDLIRRQNTQLCKCVSVEKPVAITLWCLATCSEYRTLAHLFGLAWSTICVIVHDTCRAIVSALQKLVIRFPDGDDRKVVDGFKSTWGMIQCVGSIDGCHITSI